MLPAVVSAFSVAIRVSRFVMPAAARSLRWAATTSASASSSLSRIAPSLDSRITLPLEPIWVTVAVPSWAARSIEPATTRCTDRSFLAVTTMSLPVALDSSSTLARSTRPEASSVKSPLATRVLTTTTSRSPCFTQTSPARRVSSCSARAWVFSSMARPPVATTASASTVSWSAKMSALPAAARLTVPCALSAMSPRSALLSVWTVMPASTRVGGVPEVVAVAVRLMSLRSLLPSARTLVTTSAPVLTMVIAPSAADTDFRSSAPVLASTISPAPISSSEAVPTADFRSMALKAFALRVAARIRPSVLMVLVTPPTVRVICPADCRMLPSAALSLMSPLA